MMRCHHLLPISLIACAVALHGCGESKPGAKGDSSAATVAAASKPQTSKGDLPVSKTVVWTPLIDAKMSQWRAFRKDSMPNGWSVSDSTLSKNGAVGDIQSKAQYANFELEFDWKIGAVSNSGVFYRVTEEYATPYWSGPEYQLVDDAGYPGAKDTLYKSATAYGVYAAKAGVVKAAGEWNSARIVVAGNFVEHWLNGQQVVQYQFNSPDWVARVKAGKFREYPNYGLARRGFISIQGDHPGSLSIRAMRIRELP